MPHISIENQIFQVQNAIFQTLLQANLGIDVIANRGLAVNYPYIIILGTKKETLGNCQIKTQTEINVITKDFSVISSASILEKTEKCLNTKNVAEYIQYYEVNYVHINSSETLPTPEGFFMGRILVDVILD